MILFTEHQSHTIEKKQAVDNMDEEIPPYVKILQGRDGRDGRDGMQGPRGPPGRDCCNGLGVNGSAGEPGMDGMPGQKGEQGDSGPAGRDGAVGAPGIHGAPGTDGTDGEDGEQGQRGSEGRKGDIGAPGVDGSNGSKGERGDTGPQGPLGIQGDTGPPGPPGLDENGSGGGVTYVRWGRTICPNTTGTELVYAGRVGGSHYSHSGGGGNYQCLTEEPENFDFVAGTQTGSYMYGSEYETSFSGQSTPSTSNLHDMDVPCAVCYVATKTALLMIPGKYHCPENWRREYYGYLMAERNNHHRSTFECVDANPEGTIGSNPNQNGILFYHVEPRCGSLPCLPYEQEKEMTCAVCSR